MLGERRSIWAFARSPIDSVMEVQAFGLAIAVLVLLAIQLISLRVFFSVQLR